MLKDKLRSTKGLASIRCGDDLVKLTSSRGRFAEAARAVESLDPDTIELLDADGAVLKVLQLREEGDDSDGGDDLERLGDLGKLAKVIGDISDRAAARHENAYKVAFAAQTDLVRLIADRLNSLERAWQRVIALEYKRAAESSSDDGDLDGMMGGVIKLAAAKALSGGESPAKEGAK